jgi:DNA-binding HxlR family transcriptional regulator
MLVLRDIMIGNRRYFRELVAGSEDGIATNILASCLKQLAAAELLTRDAARPGQRAAYSLTEAGIQVLPVMVALGIWGLAHRAGERRLCVRAELLRDGTPSSSGDDRGVPTTGRRARQLRSARSGPRSHGGLRRFLSRPICAA